MTQRTVEDRLRDMERPQERVKIPAVKVLLVLDAESEGRFRGNVLARFKRSPMEQLLKPMQDCAVAQREMAARVCSRQVR